MVIGGKAPHQFPLDSAASCSLFLLTCALCLMMSSADDIITYHLIGSYTRVINVGSLSIDEAKQYSYTHPKHFVKSVDCPGCYQCREMPLTPNSGPGNTNWRVYARYSGSAYLGTGFNIALANSGEANAVLTVSLPEPVRRSTEAGYDLTWGNHNPEFICRIDPRTSGPAEPDLIDDDGWTTFLFPDGTEEGGENEGGDPNFDDAINAIAAGFHPPEAMPDLESTDQSNLAAIYPPGAQVNPAVTEGPWHSREADLGGWGNLTSQADKFTLPPTTLDGARGGGYWPPKPTVKVTFMPIPVEGEGYWRHYPKQHASFGAVTKLREAATSLEWYIDSGATEADHTQSVTGETARFGWRCPARIGWFDSNWNEKNGGVWPSFVHGAAKDVGNYYQESTGADHARCPDGRLNAWEATVPNGVYTVTAGLHSLYSQSSLHGCTFENVKADGQTGNTYVFSVEVADGKFTLSSGPPSKCQAVSWLKLDMISSKVFPKPWLPAPPKAWWQLELDDATADVGMVEVRLPHEGFSTANTYPHAAEYGVADCRQWWLYAPAKCYRMFTYSRMNGIHPEMVSYPNFPGFTEPFLTWYFDQHDTNADGELVYQEFRAAQSQQFLTGNYSMWRRPAPHNTKGTVGYHDDNAAHLWVKLNVIHQAGGSSTGVITKDEWVHGMLSQPRTLFCDLFESTRSTHGGNHGTGWCARDISGPRLPEQLGHFNDDGAHGFVVSVSDTACTDQDGCPAVEPGGSSNTTLCEFRTHRSSGGAAKVNCNGAKGKYLQIALPGDSQRLVPTLFVTAHRASVALLPGTNASTATASTNPKLQTVCYGVKPRAPPAADAPDLLAAAKIHPKTIVDNNPEDPIWWSTCYDRVVIKDWLPLNGAEDGDGESYDQNGVPYEYKNGTYCLACESVRQNYGATITRQRFTDFNAREYVYDFIVVKRAHSGLAGEPSGLRIADITVDGVRVNATQIRVRKNSSFAFGTRAVVELSGKNDDSAKNLTACTGDCDDDSQCAVDLKCLQRDAYDAVPGCSGKGVSNYDYCYYPSGERVPNTNGLMWDNDTTTAAGWETDGPTLTVLSGGNVDGATNLAACTGECDDDDQCATGLKCFNREEGEEIPGCMGDGGGKSWDYCHDPKSANADADDHIFTITTSEPVATFGITYTDPKYAPGWKITENGAEFLVETANRGPAATGSSTFAYEFEVKIGGRHYDKEAMSTRRWWLQEEGACKNCDAVVFDIHTSTTTSTSTSSSTSTSTSTTTSTSTSTTATSSTATSSTATSILATKAVSNATTKGCAGLYCGESEAEVQAATETALRAALTAAGVEASTVATILAEMRSIMDGSTLATAAATSGLAAALATEKFASILADAGLDDSAVAAVAAAATAAEVEAADSNGGGDAAVPAKTNGGAVAGGIIAGLGVVGLLIGGVMMHNARNGNGAGDGAGPSFQNPVYDQGLDQGLVLTNSRRVSVNPIESIAIPRASISNDPGSRRASVNPIASMAIPRAGNSNDPGWF